MNELKEKHSQLKLHHYVGTLEMYYETGMEGCVACVFHDQRGKYTATKWNSPSETAEYNSFDWTMFLSPNICVYNARIFGTDGQVAYEGPLTNSGIKVKNSRYSFSFLPKEIEKKKWVGYLQDCCKAELWTNQIPAAIKKAYNLRFDIGSVVYDDLTGKDSVITFISLGDHNKKPLTAGYWLDNDYMGGGRHPWEVDAIDWKSRWKKEKKGDT